MLSYNYCLVCFIGVFAFSQIMFKLAHCQTTEQPNAKKLTLLCIDLQLHSRSRLKTTENK